MDRLKWLVILPSFLRVQLFSVLHVSWPLEDAQLPGQLPTFHGVPLVVHRSRRHGDHRRDEGLFHRGIWGIVRVWLCSGWSGTELPFFGLKFYREGGGALIYYNIILIIQVCSTLTTPFSRPPVPVLILLKFPHLLTSIVASIYHVYSRFSRPRFCFIYVVRRPEPPDLALAAAHPTPQIKPKSLPNHPPPPHLMFILKFQPLPFSLIGNVNIYHSL